MKIYINGDFDAEEEKVESQEIDLENFINIDAQIYAASVTVQVGSAFHISTHDINPERMKISVAEQTLFIREQKPQYYQNHREKIYIRKTKSELIITVPQTAILNEVQIKDFAGSIILSDLNMQQLEIRENAGSLKLEGVTIQNDAKIRLDAGSLDINHCKMNSNARLAAGSVKIKGLQGKNYFKLAAGSLKTLGDRDDQTDYDLSTTLGSIYFHGSKIGKHFYKHADNANQLTAFSSVGSIKIK